MNNELQSQKARLAGSTAKPEEQLSIVRQLGDFAIFMLAVLASRFLDLYGNAIPNPLFVDWKYLLFAGIVSLAAFPIVYEKAVRARSAPLLVQIALVFTTGLGWEKLLSAVDLVVPKP